MNQSIREDFILKQNMDGEQKEKINNNSNIILFNVFDKYLLRFDIGDIIYLKTDSDQRERIITGMNIRETGISYAVSCGTTESWHYWFEMSTERDVLKATSS